MFAEPTHAPQMSYYPEVPQAYGAAGGVAAAPDVGKTAFLRGQRRRMNILPLGVALFVPWSLFCVVFAVMSFSFHYSAPCITFTVVSACLLVVIAMGVMAARSATKRRGSGAAYEPTWFVFLFLTCLLAWIAGVFSGDVNFYDNMQPFYDVINLNIYTGVDPAFSRGQMIMDAGRIIFTDDARLDLQKSIGFKNNDMYCVAPVSRRSNTTGGQFERLPNYDFWAVGTNCCSNKGADFRCGQFANPHAHGGLRLMKDNQRAYFRLAVQQAEAAYSIKAAHPIFLDWMQDPVAEVNSLKDGGYKSYLLGVCSFFVLQTFLVATAVVAFSKLGH